MTATTLTLALLAALLTPAAHALCLCSNATSVDFDCTPRCGSTFPSSVWKISCHEDDGVFGGSETWPNFEGLDFLQEFYIDDVSVEGQLDVLGDHANLTVLWTGPNVELENFPEGLARSSSLRNLTITSSELQSVFGKFWVVKSLVKVELNSTKLECLSPLSLATKASVSLNGGESVCLTRFWDDVENKHTSFFAFFFSVSMIAIITLFVTCCSICSMVGTVIDVEELPYDTLERERQENDTVLLCLCLGLLLCLIGTLFVVSNFGYELWPGGDFTIYSDPLAAEPKVEGIMVDRYEAGSFIGLAGVVSCTLFIVAVYLVHWSSLVMEAGASGCVGLLTFLMNTVIFIVVTTITFLLVLIPATGGIRYPELRTSYLSICPQQGICANTTHFWDWHAEAYAEFSSPYFSSHPVYSIYISDPSVPASYYEIESRFGNYPSSMETSFERSQYDSDVMNEIYHVANTLRYFGNLDQEFSRATLCREIDASWEGACPISAYVDVYSRSFYEHPIFQSVLLFAVLFPGAMLGSFILVTLLRLLCYSMTRLFSPSVMRDRTKQVEDIEGMVFPMDEITNTVPRAL